MLDSHRIRRLNWQARAGTPEQAFALRSLLHERIDAVQVAIERTLAELAPTDAVWHLPRLTLRLEPADLATLDAELEARLGSALRAALGPALAEASRQPALAATGRDADRSQAGGQDQTGALVDAASSRRLPSADAAIEALRDYLASGLPPWPLAGLDDVALRRSLGAAAEAAVEAVLAGRLSLVGLLPTTFAAQRGALLRWLDLLPDNIRQRWWRASAAPAVPLPVLSIWRARLEGGPGTADEAARRVVLALWLAWPAPPRAPELSASGMAEYRTALRELLAGSGQLGAAGGATPTEVAAAEAWLRGADPAEVARARASRGAELNSPATATAASATPSRQAGAIAADAGLIVPLAGLVLLHPFLPRLLGGCGVLDAAGRQIADAQWPRAAALLHALACGEPGTVPEPAEFELPFVKLLLGRAPTEPFDMALPRLPPADQEEVDALLAAVREHWTALRGTGTDALRRTFLQRRGLLRPVERGWQLRLQSEAFDLLLSRLPWSISLIKLPWMAQPLSVEWPAP
ncbi:MAG: contractile injection system tape measure protein [Leptothrix sp. (in: b-proteobacteria)]